MKRFLVVFEKTNTGYSVYVPDLPGCISTGETKEEAEKNIYEAIELHLEGLLEDNEEIPTCQSEAEVLLIG